MNITNKLFEALDAGATRLEELLQEYPYLSTAAIRESISDWHKHKIQIRLHQMGEGGNTDVHEAQNIRELAIELLGKNGLEDTLDILLSRHNVEMTMPKLVHMIGRDVYIAELRQDAQALVANAISYEQIASLWNDLDRPALGGHPRWSGRNVSILVD
ncbi:MAG: hypothetical protein RPU52_06360 [Candidatus Sedimenticola sp. (ex Thyasira tokunagai)]